MPDAGKCALIAPDVVLENDQRGCCYPCYSDSKGNSRTLG